MSTARTCPRCGTALSDDALGGLCLKCLGRLGFCFTPDGHESETAGGATRAQRFNDYELIQEIARGGMGVVYKARQLSLNRIVAVKMVLHGPFSSEEFVQRFRTEAQAAAGLHHPNIVAIYEVGQHDGQHFFSMEYIEGQNLAEVVREKPLPAKRAAGYLKSIAEAMDYAHQKGILHRDLKPSNLLLDIFDQPRITDFGLAKLLTSDSQLTVTGQALGSPSHMPPEQAAGKFGAASAQGDIYSLGAVLYHLVTGRPPFQGEALPEVLLQVQNAEPVPPRRLNPSVPVDLETICLKCLQKEPARRYTSARELAQDLGRFIAGEPIHARPVSPAQKLWLWCRRHPVPAGLSAALVMAVLLGLGGILLEWRRAEQHALGESTHRRLAEDFAAKVRLNLYAADVSLASQALQHGDYGVARRTLHALQPKPGDPDLRGFEWRYLWNLCRGDQLATLTGHAWIVTCVAFSPNGRLIATGSQDGTAKVWDATRNELITTLAAIPGSVWSTAFSPDGGLLMTASTRGVSLWNTATWQLVTTFPGQLAALSKTGSVMAVSQSSPFYWEPSRNVVLWNYRTGEKLKELSERGRALALSPGDKMLAVAGATKGVLLWDVATGKIVSKLLTDEPVWSLAFSPSGNQLVAVGWSTDVLLWDLAGARTPVKLNGHLRTVWSAAFSPDGSTLVTSSSDQTIRSWDTKTLRPKVVLRGHENEVWCVAFSPDGRKLASGGKDQTVRLWSTESPARQDRLPQEKKTRPLFSPDGAQVELLTQVGSEWRPTLWSLDRRTPIMEIPGEYSSGFSPDGTRLLHLNDRDGTLERWSQQDRSGDSLKLEGIAPGTTSFARSGFSPDWDVLFAMDDTGIIRLWQTASGKLLASVQGPKPPLCAAALGPRGTHLAVTLERENIVRLYETRTARETHLEGHRDFVTGLAFSPAGTTLATGSMDGTLRLWDVATAKELGVLRGHMEEVTDVAFSPDGRTLASVGHKDSLKLWHLSTQRELLSIDFPQAGIILQFSPDGRHLAVTTEENSIRLFDAPALEELERARR